ncbi:hypothetical protein BDQ17DRAFT_1327285 [Cyathus striatus]|nr:hypothetical protein BDQ17DRAFT_1327285 [Cyathus striatus]
MTFDRLSINVRELSILMFDTGTYSASLKLLQCISSDVSGEWTHDSNVSVASVCISMAWKTYMDCNVLATRVANDQRKIVKWDSEDSIQGGEETPKGSAREVNRLNVSSEVHTLLIFRPTGDRGLNKFSARFSLCGLLSDEGKGADMFGKISTRRGNGHTIPEA